METKSRTSSAFRYIGVFIAILLCLSIVVDMMSFKRLSFLYEKSPKSELVELDRRTDK
ncbi:ECU02_0425 [Encephalitozoon cuniculi GB-M1]|uniref:ECU02_0425 protein n=1 Tax=Encephalitozoon cuniculi (strain GB-M1) TaxID=284813 RepID=A0A1T5PCS9_ENCCU|nr:uncharacterized protein ECU02_0425 [Encephalitozoon cuniculi GB-M1]UYI28232.1 hypothetical protein J0A71_10g21340 [Encephalitozoon cuniculi]SKD10683.1 ECU02_0425 [Encephalitozoon cuniculi GB-M1]